MTGRNQPRPVLKRPLRILFVEDSLADFELSVLQLKKASLVVVADLVQTKGEFTHNLSANRYDVVVADYQLPGWSGIDALNLMHERGIDIPFILITGVLDDQAAVDCIKQGAADYILKDRLARLPVAICRSLEEAFLREERDRAKARSQEGEETFRTLSETIASAIFIYQDVRCQYANHAAELITGYTREELLSMTLQDFFHPDFTKTVVQMSHRRAPEDISSVRHGVKIITKSGEVRWLDLTSSVVEVEGKPGTVITAFDITARKKAEDEIRHLVASDPLTGLANYRRLVEAFDSELERSGRTGRSFAFVLLDLDGLKQINDTYGHLAGSRALCRVSNILCGQSRGLDVLARYGGDEFAAILPETGAEEARQFAQRISHWVQNDGEQPPTSVSFGIATCPQDGTAFTDLLKIADGGLYLMKAQHNKDIAS